MDFTFLLESKMMLMQSLTAALLAILFLQSGLDKVFNWKGNLEWLTGHFSKTFLAGSVPFMLAVVTLAEVLAGAFSAIGVVMILFTASTGFAFIGALLSALSLLMLFFGQRIAQDYPGAASLIPYFILSLIGMYIC
ncbi:MAG: DoxX family protein [Bernardetiaceae bacterium]|nr:DoxX family protein [Bernardetiaceae bacterium]